MKYLLIALLQIGVGIFMGFMIHDVYFSDEIENEIVEIEVRIELTEEQQKVVDDFRKEKERLEEEEYQKQKKEFEDNKAKWLKDNPPVKELWDGNQRDLEYTIEYIQDNWYHGDCSLAWRLDVLCWGFGGNKLVFPIERPKLI